MTEPIFEISDDDRYSRLQLIAWWDQRRLQKSRVLVIGAGALGNEVIKNLALVGVGRIDLVDFDRIEDSNLSRAVLFRERDRGQFKAEVAARAVREINPAISIEPWVGNVLCDVGLGLVRASDLVIACLDNREARLWVNRMCWKVNRPWVDGGIQEINGVVKVFRPPEGPCYECGMTDADYRLIQLRYSCPLLRQSDLQQGRVPTAPTIASIIGGLQVQEALKLLHGIPTGEATALVFNGAANQFYRTRFPIKPDCLSHETYEDIESIPLSAEATVDELFRALDYGSKGSGCRLLLDRDWVESLDCSSCARRQSVQKPLPLLGLSDAVCPSCRQVMQPRMIHHVDAAGPWADRSLRQMGIPDWDILRIQTETQIRFVELRPGGDSNLDWRK
jgi:adenylyltransferase/sulfurtransferase